MKLKSSIQFFDEIKTKYALTSDEALANKLNIPLASLPLFYSNQAFMDEAIAIRVARLLGLKIMYVLSCVQAERAKFTDVRSIWQVMAHHSITRP